MVDSFKKVMAAFGVAFGASAIFNKPMHLPQVPEMARYVFGGALFSVIAYIMYGDSGPLSMEKILVCWVITGVGVAANRLRAAILYED
jgi:hypothetical protein